MVGSRARSWLAQYHSNHWVEEVLVLLLDLGSEFVLSEALDCFDGSLVVSLPTTGMNYL